MSALTLSGIPLPVLADRGLTYTPTLLGEHRRAFSGWLRTSERREVITYAGNTGPLSQEEARAYRGLLKGEGHVWNFDVGMRSNTFLLPSGTVGTMSVWAGGRFGACLRMSVSSSITLPVALGPRWTVAYWWKLEGTAHWTHFVHRSGHLIASNGQGDAVPSSEGALVVDDAGALPGGDVTLRILPRSAGGLFNPNNAALLVDDVVVLPWVMPSSWLSPWFSAGQPFGAPYPYHLASGRALFEPRVVLGRMGQGRAVQWWQDGGFVLGQEFDFELQER
ncbi:hypothetical protein MYSTI_03273 [Myxococcus stipitatus DSM 14675]|uniref:Uncharacterized protein n=1 Tax=Myxococcus stipitatus (strain DSM 14675 / JCM 12634 / Mx s8) TaxID=1278073 RepID=L7U9Q3_MYXSD|nr:hypothetical protein [Myxococcus stipitatus]AGC44585.1 hypothetical protein MYSTI_03273 [Myxococcus stipitatus DSM 14675]